MQNNNTELVLIESRSARTSAIANYSDERAIEILNKAKALVMAVWQGTGVATNKQLAQYFEVSEDVVRDNLRRNKEELELDGVKTLTGKALRHVCESISQSHSRIPSLTVWTPRATLRLGMLLRDSSVAKELRSTLCVAAIDINGDQAQSVDQPTTSTIEAQPSSSISCDRIELEIKEGEVRIDSRIICAGLGVSNHKDYRNNILEKYEASLAILGGVFKTPLPDGTIVWYLNEAQAHFAGTLSRNTKEAVEFKLQLVQAFSKMKAQIQSDLEKKVRPQIATPTQKEIRASYSLWKMAHGKAYADRWLMQMHQRHYPALVGDAPRSEEMASLPTAKSLLTPTQLAKELKLFCKSNPSTPDARRVNSLLAELGYQESIGGRWSATQKAIDLNLVDRKPVDTNSRTQKDQLLWSADILPILSEHLPAKS